MNKELEKLSDAMERIHRDAVEEIKEIKAILYNGLRSDVKQLMEDRKERKWINRTILGLALAIALKDVIYPLVKLALLP